MMKIPHVTNPTSQQPRKLCSGFGPNGPGPDGRRPGVTDRKRIHDDSVFTKGPGVTDRKRIHDDSVFMQGPDRVDRSRVHDDSVFMQVPDISKMFGG